MSPSPEHDEKRMTELGAEGWDVADTVQERGEGRVIMRRAKR